MKNNFQLAMSLVVFILCATGLTAQQSRGTKTQRPVSQTLSLIGCVDRADQLNAASPDTTVDSLSFVLTHASRDGKAAASTPAAEARRAVEPGSIYRLDGTVAMINPHVGHKVQVTGTVEAAAAGTSGTADPASAASAPKLKVDRIKMLDETCAR